MGGTSSARPPQQVCSDSWQVLGSFSRRFPARETGGRSSWGGLEAALAFAPPALPGAGSWGGGGGPGCPAVPSSGMLALLPGWENSLWSWGHQHSPLQYPSKTLILHIPGQRQNNPTYLLAIATPQLGEGDTGSGPLWQDETGPRESSPPHPALALGTRIHPGGPRKQIKSL